MIVLDGLAIWSTGLSKSDKEIKVFCIFGDQKVFEGTITNENRPKSRTDNSWLETVARALTEPGKHSSSDYDFSMSAKASISSSSPKCEMELIIKENVEGSSAKVLLLKTTVHEVVQSDIAAVNSNKNAFFTIFMQIKEKFASQHSEIQLLREELVRAVEGVERLTKEVEKMTEFKDKLQDNLISKMCLLLNTKKEEIRRLRSSLPSNTSESNNSSNNTSNSNSNIEDGYDSGQSKSSTALKSADYKDEKKSIGTRKRKLNKESNNSNISGSASGT
jgi:regulator of replication initiation timing